jgi:hypothetical protein
MAIGSHVIPRYYLEQFAVKETPTAKSGLLWIYYKNATSRRKTAKRTGIKYGYFAVRLPSGEMDESFEAEIQKYETAADDVLVMAVKECFYWDDRRRRTMAIYAAILYARTIARHNALAWLSAKTSEEMKKAAEDQSLLEELGQFFSARYSHKITALDVKASILRVTEDVVLPQPGKENFIAEVLPTARYISEILLEKPWQIWTIDSDAEFITSDNPLVTGIPINGELAPGWGFRTEYKGRGVLVFLALNPKSCLVMGTAGNDRKTVSSDLVHKVNDVIITQIVDQAYSRTKSEKFETSVREYGGTYQFGKTAFVRPGIVGSSVKDMVKRYLKIKGPT